MSSVEPGWYAAQGDPPGTQRYWNGSQWVGDPQPIASATSVAESPPATYGSQADPAGRVPQPKSENPIGWFLLFCSRWLDFKGRARRSEHWWGTLISSVLIFVLVIFALFVGLLLGEFVAWLLILVLFVVNGLAQLSSTVRRLHDIGRSAWWLLVNFIPIVGPFVLLYFALLDSDPGTNRYGMSPKSMFNNR